jgi:hypothetical protein
MQTVFDEMMMMMRTWLMRERGAARDAFDVACYWLLASCDGCVAVCDWRSAPNMKALQK